MSRFVVLEHDHPFLHWDLMLEVGTALRTWRLHAPPDTTTPITAETLADHRLSYLEYAGPVGGGRGSVKKWDGGEFEMLRQTVDRIEVDLHGETLSGLAVLWVNHAGQWTFQRTG